LVYEGEQEGAASVANSLIADAIKTLFPEYFPKIEKLEKEGYESPYQNLINWFFEESGFELLDDISDKEYKEKLNAITPLKNLINEYHPEMSTEESYFMMEFLLWGLVEFKKLSKHRLSEGFHFNDLYGSYISGL
jgi:magnesium chelatase subunit I